MSIFKAKVNSYTGARELEGPAEFLSWVTVSGSDEPLESENSNGKAYRLANARVELTNSQTGEVNTRVVTAIVYEGNYNHAEADFVKGQSYLTTISEGTAQGDEKSYFRMSHLQNNQILSKEEIGFDALFEAGSSSETSQEAETVEESEGVEAQF